MVESSAYGYEDEEMEEEEDWAEYIEEPELIK
jgi:hypothetical protein